MKWTSGLRAKGLRWGRITSGQASTDFRYYTRTLMLLWTIFVGVSLWWGLTEINRNIISQATVQGRAAAEVGNRYRRWVSQLGGVYAPVEPLPQISTAEEDRQARTVTAEGQALDLLTPVDMTRLVYAAIPENQLGTWGRIISNDFRVASTATPDEWEKESLANLIAGQTGEVSEVADRDGQDYLRLFLPLSQVEYSFQPALTQAELKSAISMLVPLAPLAAAARSSCLFVIISHLLLWPSGLAGMALVTSRFQEEGRLREQATEELRLLTSDLERRINERTATLWRRQRQFQSFIDNLGEGVYLKNERHEFIMANPRFCDLLKTSLDKVLGTAGYPMLSPAQAWKVEELERQVVRKGHPIVLEGLFDSSDNDGAVYNLSIFPVLGPDDHLEGIGGILFDVTAHHHQRRELAKAKIEAETASLAKSIFLANVSHEIRTPLNGVSGMAALMLRSDLTAEQASMAATIKNAGNSLLLILNDILDLSKIEAGKMALNLRPFSLHELIFHSVKNVLPLAQVKYLEIIVNLAPELPDGFYGDADRLRQILLNLLSNAIKFTKKGEITLVISLLEISEPGPAGPEGKTARLRLAVKDTGIGIAWGKQDIIFEAFEQADTTITRKYGGTGLGLPLCQKLAGMMGARIFLESRLNEGSTFWFDLELPLRPEAASIQPPVDPAAFQGHSVLCVDDNETNRKIMVETIRGWHLSAHKAAGVDEALGLLRAAAQAQTPFSLVLSDFQMPDKNGLHLLQTMKADPMLSDTPVVLLSSVNLPAEELRDMPLAARLTKPVSPQELMRVMAAALGIWESFDFADLNRIVAQELARVSSRRLSVLLVEDMEMNQVVVMRMLEELGHRVALASNGAEALKLIQDEVFDLIFMDIQMPVMDGLEAVARILALEESRQLSHAPIVAMTAHAMKGDREKYLALGLDDYLSKPILMSELSRIIEELIDRWGIAGDPPAVEVEPAEPLAAQPPAPVALEPGGLLDFGLMKLSFGENAALIRKSMDIYLRDAPLLLEEIKAHLAEDHPAEAAVKAHALKGISGYYTKTGPFELARELDKRASVAAWPDHKIDILALAGELELSLTRLMEAMRNHLNEIN